MVKRILRRYISPAIIRRIQASRERLLLGLASVLSKMRWLSSLYYLITGSFGAEHSAVLKGRLAYRESIKNIADSCALLRRNIHRLEKGLIMRPRRPVFAEGFIQETVECYKNAILSGSLDKSEKKWARDVLDEYFNVVHSTTITDCARSVYEVAKSEESIDAYQQTFGLLSSETFKPYPYNTLPALSMTFEDLQRLFIRRRSVRWYRDEYVSKKLVQKASNLASLAPSACNRQPYRFLFCNQKEKVVAIAKCAGGTVGFAENLPAIIAIVGDLSSYPYERDRHLIYIDGSLAAMQMMLALETLGLSSCSINWPDVEWSERKLRNIISLKDYERVVMLLAVGYADEQGGIPYSQKKIDNLILEDIS